MRMHHPGKAPAADQAGRTATPAPHPQAAIYRSAVGDVPGGRGQPLAAPVVEGMTARLGGDFSHVPVYTDSAARAAAAAAGALVYTSGPNVAAGDGGAGNDTPAVQRSIGNAAVSRMLERARHQHGAGGAQQQAGPAAVQRSAVQDVLHAPGQPLSAPVKEEMEARLGADFSQVRVHTDDAARASAADIGARAYTFGNHVVIGDGGADKHTLAHELSHVMQQREGPVAGTDHGNGLKVSNPSDRFEREAAANAAQAMSEPTPGRSTGHASTRPDSASAAGRGSAIQRAIFARDVLGQAPSYKRFGPTARDSATKMEAQFRPGQLPGGSGVDASRPKWPGSATSKPWAARLRSGQQVLQRDPILSFTDNWKPDMDLAAVTLTLGQLQEAVLHLWDPDEKGFWDDMTQEVAHELLTNSAFEPLLTGLRRLGYHDLLNGLRDVAHGNRTGRAPNQALNAWIANLTFNQATTDKFRADHVAGAATVSEAVNEARKKRGTKSVSTLLVLSDVMKAALTAEVQQLNRTIAESGEHDTRARFRLTQATVEYVSAYEDGRSANGRTRFWYTVNRNRDGAQGWSMHHLDALYQPTASGGSEAREAPLKQTFPKQEQERRRRASFSEGLRSAGTPTPIT